MFNSQRIKKDCFWDFDISSDEILNIANSDDTQKLNMLFEKILLNSTSFLNDLEVFDRQRLETLLENYQVPRFNGDFAFRRKNMAEVYFFDKPLLIDELKWVA